LTKKGAVDSVRKSLSQDLQDKVTLVTGGARGLGAATCRTLGAERATVMVIDVRADLAEEVAAEVRASGGRAEALQCDVSDPSQGQVLVHEVIAKYGRVDILINSAGTDLTMPFTDLPIDEWDRILAVNLRGPFLMSKWVFPSMCEQRQGHIVNIVSTAAKRAWANASAYHASKWGLLGLSHALHVEARSFNVKVTAVIAGGMRTPFLLERFPDLNPDLLQDPQNVAETIRFLLLQPAETVIPEVTVIPMRETSWP
jgi:NAD(P)-dependent dehydrogenase (short-subunit alcohol dehydrogenase family)